MSIRIALIASLICCAPALAAEADHEPATTQLTGTPSNLRILQDEAATTADLLRQVNEQLELIGRAASPAPTTLPVTPPELRERRLKALKELKQRYQFRNDDLARDIREKTARLAIDGMNVTASNRPGAIEAEIDELTRLRTDLERQLVAAPNEAAKQAATAALKELPARRDQLRKELGELQVMMLQYNQLKADHEHARRLLRETNDEIERIEIDGKSDFTPQEARERGQNEFLERNVMLNNLKQRYQFRLDELRREIRDAEAREVADLFTGGGGAKARASAPGLPPPPIDVFLTPESLNANTPTLGSVTFDGTRELAGKRYVRLRSADQVWSIDPAHVIAVRATATPVRPAR